MSFETREATFEEITLDDLQVTANALEVTDSVFYGFVDAKILGGIFQIEDESFESAYVKAFAAVRGLLTDVGNEAELTFLSVDLYDEVDEEGEETVSTEDD